MALSSYALISLALAFFAGATMHAPPDMASSLARLNISGHFVFPGEGPHDASRDFGNRRRSTPCAVLYPSSVGDIAAVVRYAYELGGASNLTVAARGHGHSLQGQAQAEGGVVVMMESLKEPGITVDHEAGEPSADVPAGSLWIDVLLRALEHGLAPRSWTDYLHLSVGGTLSNAGISGQAFRHGPQISNVRSLEIVTGKGEIVNCSATLNSNLYFATLGGLGQFGIITRARIKLEPAPSMVKWIRVLYSDFRAFTEDQEMLVSREQTFDYIEGFVVKNTTGLLSNWRSFLNPHDPFEASKFASHGKILFCLEMTKNFYPAESDRTNEETNIMLSKLRYIPSTLFYSEVSYVDFLNRVHLSELKLRSRGLWDVPHPWLNLLVPRSRIRSFGQEAFGTILDESSNGPILVYPMTKSRWDSRTSAVTPEEEIFYLVAFLPSVSSLADRETMEILLQQNERILDFGRTAGIQLKQYLPHYTTLEGWKDHFGAKWEEFLRRKLEYDPLAILAPGQRIFRRVTGTSG